MKKLFIPWIAIICLAQIFLSTTEFKSQSNDSKFYTELVVRYHQASFKEMLTPKWGNNYGADPNSYMRDQFPGQLLMGILGTKLGVPPAHSLHVIEMWLQFFSILFLFYLFKKERSSFIFLGLLLTSNAFSYNIRANHESGLMFFSLMALLGGFECHFFLIFFSTLMLLFIKGPFLIFGFLLSFLGGFYSNRLREKKWFFIFTYLGTAMLAILFVQYFEYIFKQITGLSFLDEFVAIQFKKRAFDLPTTHSFIIQKILNFSYYFQHVLTYSLPWSFVALALGLKKLIKKEGLIWNKALSMLFFASIIYCGVFSLSNRIAGRYVFPAYYFFTALVVMFIYLNSKGARQLTQYLETKKLMFPLIIGLWFLAFGLHFI